MAEDWRQGGFGLYIHWPFCTSKCPYCDFNSHVAQTIDQKAWAGAYLDAIGAYAAETPDRLLNSVYFGGGTPSLMASELVGAILEKVHRAWPIANDLEVTLEANPGSVEAARFAGYRAAGVNRVSIGVQALNDPDLRRLGRLHSTQEALAALETARNTFDRVSFDLIYGRQDQTLPEWEAELIQALAFAPEHLSLYQLTIESGTAFGDRFEKGKLPGLPGESLGADLYMRTQEICNAAGLPAYEVSNHAKPGQESRHNLIYWQGGDYIGIGPGAHGRLTIGGTRYATRTALGPDDWLNKSGSLQREAGRDALPAKDHAGEYLMMSLRTTGGTSLSRFAEIAGAPLDRSKVDDLAGFGHMQANGDRIQTTPQGRMILNALIEYLLPD